MDTPLQSNENDSPQSNPEEPAPSAGEQRYAIPFEFKGNTGEYFKIWIVNLFLSVITLGIYIPWAKVRSRRYFHANTFLDGHAFDYLAKPLNLLAGYLILLVFVGLYNLSVFFNPLFLIPVAVIYLAGFPWLIYKAFRFKARNTAYRNLRFKYLGELGESYTLFLLWPILIPFTFGLIFPYWAMKKKIFFLDNLSFGKSKFSLKPSPGEYYKWYIIFWAAAMVLYLVVVFLMIGGAFGVAALGGEFSQTTQSGDIAENPFDYSATSGFFIGMAVLFYVLFIAAAVIWQQGLWMLIFNYNMSVWETGNLRFKSSMQFWPFCQIMVTNAFLSILSLGFLIPWAKVRATRYLLENMFVISPTTTLGEFADDASDEESAIGDAAVDYFDFEVGW